MNHNVLVAGGAGFIGSYICRQLVLNGDNVVCLDDLSRGNLDNIKDINEKKNFHFFKLDANDEKEIFKILNLYKIEYVMHLAANSDIQASADNPSIEFSRTAATTWHILSAMRRAKVKNIFFASTSAVYGENGMRNFKESDQLNPISYYGAAKMASEAFIRSFSYMNGFNALIFRFPNVIGPHLTHGVFYDFIRKLKNNSNELHVLGNGTQSKPYLHVSDLAKAIFSLVWVNKGVNVYNVGVDSFTDVKTIAQMIISEMHLNNCKIIYGNKNVGWKGDVPHFSFCLDKIKEIGWTASMTSDEACLQTIKEVLGN